MENTESQLVERLTVTIPSKSTPTETTVSSATIIPYGINDWDMHNPSSDLIRVPNDKIEVYQFDNFLTLTESKRLVDYMENNYIRSTVSSPDGTSVVGEGRTSSSTYFDLTDPFIKYIEHKIAVTIGIDIEYGEGIQGQRYEVGEYFDYHMDYFSEAPNQNTTFYENFIGEAGNRTWTFVIYLSDETDGLEGGETDFKNAGITVKPKTGKAVCWRNMNSDRSLNSFTLHSGVAPTKGKKYIITKWFREKPTGAHMPVANCVNVTNVAQDKSLDHRGIPISNNINESEKHYFSSIEELPYLDKNGVGFEKRKLPEDIWNLVKEAYDSLLPEIAVEDPSNTWITEVIRGLNGENVCEIMPLDNRPRLKKKIHESLQPIIQEWIGEENPISPSSLYGIRSYKRGAVLDMHADRFDVLHAGCIVMVDKQVEEDWPLHCVDYNGCLLYTSDAADE